MAVGEAHQPGQLHWSPNAAQWMTQHNCPGWFQLEILPGSVFLLCGGTGGATVLLVMGFGLFVGPLGTLGTSLPSLPPWTAQGVFALFGVIALYVVLEDVLALLNLAVEIILPVAVFP